MDVSNALMEIATELTKTSQARFKQTNVEIEDLEAQLRQLRAQRDGQLDARKRLDAYQPWGRRRLSLSQLLDQGWSAIYSYANPF